MRSTKRLMALGLLFSASSAMALPIDWNGSLAFDDTLINNIRHTNDDVTTSGTGSQGIKGSDDSAHFQTYIFKLNPHMIVNDSVSVKGEFSTGYARGGFAGDNTTQTQDSSGNSDAYYSTVPAQRSALNVNQLYAELYADTALIKVGRFAKEFGTGAILSAGKGTFDRFYTQYDGIQGEMRIGNFALTPHWARLGTYDSNRSSGQANGSRDVREMGLTATYDNKSTNTIIALNYSKRFSEPKNDLYNTNTGSASADRGRTDVTLIDAYLAKKWEKATLSIEVPTMSGDFGNAYADGTKSRISSSAFLIETVWSPNVRWDLGAHFGQVGGDKGQTQRFEGMKLNPNYQIAELMFHYNYNAFNNGSQSIFDRGITNAQFLKLHGHYKTDKWTWNGAWIMAKAMETAKAGKQAYQHEEGYRYTANEDQKDSYGNEFDFSFDYQWNPNVKVSGWVAYWLVGDYYSFDNSTSSKLSVSNTLGSGVRLGIEF